MILFGRSEAECRQKLADYSRLQQAHYDLQRENDMLKERLGSSATTVLELLAKIEWVRNYDATQIDDKPNDYKDARPPDGDDYNEVLSHLGARST